MKTGGARPRFGHYWCDECDELAIAGKCRKGHHVRFVPDPPERKPTPEPLPLERGYELFKQVFAAVHH